MDINLKIQELQTEIQSRLQGMNTNELEELMNFIDLEMESQSLEIPTLYHSRVPQAVFMLLCLAQVRMGRC